MTSYLIYFSHVSLPMRIGIHQHEKGRTQNVVLNVLVRLARPPALDDDPAQLLDYDMIHDHILQLAGGDQILLQETLCGRLIEFIRRDPRVQGVGVQSAKPEAFADVSQVGCIFTWGDVTMDQLLLACHGKV